jgi:hypothetical protein
MRIPNESLDDFKVPSEPKPVEPPAWRPVRPSGKFEIVKPLAGPDLLAKNATADVGGPLPVRAAGDAYRLSWFHQSLAVGGAIALVALFLVTGLYIGIGDRPVELGRGRSDVAMNRHPAKTFSPAEVPPALDPSTAEDSPSTVGDVPAAKPAARRRHSRPRPSFAAYRPRRRAPLIPQFVVSQFVPTTLVIYAENGEIKTRIEPWLTAAVRKPLAFPN